MEGLELQRLNCLIWFTAVDEVDSKVDPFKRKIKFSTPEEFLENYHLYTSRETQLKLRKHQIKWMADLLKEAISITNSIDDVAKFVWDSEKVEEDNIIPAEQCSKLLLCGNLDYKFTQQDNEHIDLGLGLSDIISNFGEYCFAMNIHPEYIVIPKYKDLISNDSGDGYECLLNIDTYDKDLTQFYYHLSDEEKEKAQWESENIQDKFSRSTNIELITRIIKEIIQLGEESNN